MTALVPLGAVDAGDLIKIAVFILIVLVPVVLQIAGKARKQQQQPGGGPRPGHPRAGGPRAGGGGGNIEEDIGEFLRRAAERRGAGAAPQAPPPARPRPVDAPVEAEVVGEVPLGGQLREHVGKYLNSSKFQHRAAELGDEVAQADDLLEQRLRQRFDHEVSRIAGKPGASAAPPLAAEAGEPEDRVIELPPTAAVGVAAMLRDVGSIRRAIIISEILNRPEDRWA